MKAYFFFSYIFFYICFVNIDVIYLYIGSQNALFHGELLLLAL